MVGGLGRGLNSLIPNKVAPQQSGDNSVAPSGERVLQIDPNLVKSNPHQPRHDFDAGAMAELADSIREHGILQPLVVTRQGNVYELIAGERRLRAAKIAGLATVPVIIREADEQNKAELALIENIQRENLNPIELAKAYRQLVDDFSLTHEALGKKLGKTRATVTNLMRLLSLPPEIQAAVTENKINQRSALVLLGVTDPVQREKLFQKLLSGETGGNKEIDQEVRHVGGSKMAQIKAGKHDAEYEAAFARFFNTKAKLERKRYNTGRMVIEFFSEEELDEMARKVESL